MRITFNKETALAILRAYRADQSRAPKLARRAGLATPDASPQRRWTRGLIDGLELGVALDFQGKPVQVIVPDGEHRVRAKGVECVVCGNGQVPDGSFINLAPGLSICGPELLFVQMAEYMHPVEHLMLGHELCGTFSRAPHDPYNGDIVFGVPPLTTSGKIRDFMERARFVRGIDAARVSAEYLNDNAWSPTESVIAAFLRLPPDSLGYGLGELVLNPRKFAELNLPGARESRVPDIIVAGTPVGLNYDGLQHLDLGSIASAAVGVGMHPEASQPQQALEKAMRDVRTKALDDIRRNRELAVGGLTVLPVLKEDLYAPGGLDSIASSLMTLLERRGRRNMESQRRLLRSRTLKKARFQLLLSFLPGRNARNVQVGRFIQGHPVVQGDMRVHEQWIEL